MSTQTTTGGIDAEIAADLEAVLRHVVTGTVDLLRQIRDEP